LETPEASDNVGISSITNDAPEFFTVGETIVHWTATDHSGNTHVVSQSIAVVDTIPPKFSKMSAVVAEATSVDNNNVSLQAPDVSDILDIITLSNDAPATFPLGETTVTWTATDEAGNSATATQLVSIIDTTAPQLTIPQNIVVDAISLNTPVQVGTATAQDLTDKSPKITNNAPEVFPLGETIVTWTVVDMFGNMENQTQTVTVQACGKSVDSYNTIMGTEDDDILTGTTFADLIFGLGGDDVISGQKGNDCIFGGDGEDIIYGNEGNDTINGEGGADIIKGQSDEDVLIGSAGNDIIDGGDGNDFCVVTPTDNDILLNCEQN
jgi:Ca2+-binding RTX toxin-like protein